MKTYTSEQAKNALRAVGIDEVGNVVKLSAAAQHPIKVTTYVRGEFKGWNEFFEALGIEEHRKIVSVEWDQHVLRYTTSENVEEAESSYIRNEQHYVVHEAKA